MPASRMSAASSSSSSAPSSVPAQPPLASLFRDGLSSIFVFLDTRSFIASAGVSKYYFRVARVTKMNLSFTLHRTHYRDPAAVSAELKASSSSVSSSQVQASAVAASPWCLPHCFTRLFLPDPVSCLELPFQLQQSHFAPIKSLHIKSINDSTSSDTDRRLLCSVIDLGFPVEKLTSLAIEHDLKHYRGILRPASVNLLVKSLARCTKITNLSLLDIPVGLVDFAPMCALTQVRVCKLRVTMPSPREVIRFCTVIGQMKSLNELTFDVVDSADFTPSHIECLQLPLLYRFESTNARPNYATLAMMSRVMPELEEFYNSRTIPTNVSGLTLFPQLRKVHLQGRSTIDEDNHIGSDHEVVNVLCMSSHWSAWVNHLHLRNCVFGSSEDWSRIAVSLSSLAELNFERSAGNLLNITGTIGKQFSSLRLLKLVYCDVPDLLTRIRHLTQLTQLHVLQDEYRALPVRDVYSTLNDAQFLPRLSKVIWQSPIDIHYDFETGINQVIFVGQSEEERILHRTRQPKIDQEPDATPPQLRLVGIELNPGPQSHDGSSTSITSSSSSSSSSSSASSSSFHSSPSFPSLLFCDGLSSIFAFLDTRSFIQAATVCRYYFLIATRTRMHVSLTLNDTSFVPSLVKIQEQRSMIEKSIIEQNEPRHPAVPLPTSKWSLPHRITRVNLPNLVPWFTLPYHLAQYTRISTLTIATIHDGPSATTKDLGLPYDTLTSLTIERNGAQLLSEKAASVLVTSLGRCIKLTHLKLMEVPLHNARPDGSLPSPPTFSFRPDAPFDYTPLHELTQLRVCILRIQLPSSLDATTQFCHALGQMKSLIHLSLDLISGGDLGQDQLRLLQLPQLTHFSSINTRLDYVSLNVMSRVMPQLEMINISRTIPINITGLALHTHLTSIHLYGRTLVGQDNHPGEENEIVDVLCSSKWTSSIIHLHLRNCVFQSSQDWSRISTSLTSLTSLELERSGGNLVPLAQGRAGANDLSVAESMTRLQQLKLVYSDINDLLLYLRKFTHITQLYVREDSSRAIEPRSVLAAFNQSDYLPQLKKLEWPPRGDINIHFDLNANINYVKFGDQIRPQTEEEKRLHRIPPLSRDDVSTTPPQSRLVGIEPNPGPATATTLFTDGLKIIQSYLSDCEWVISARVCRRWFSVASATPMKNRTITLHHSGFVSTPPPPPPAVSIQKQAAGFFSRIFGTKGKSQSISPWSFIHRVTALQIESISWTEVAGKVAQYTSLTSLTIMSLERDSTTTIEPRATKISLPQSLRSVSITLCRDNSDLRFLYWQSVIHSVGALTQLESLTLRSEYLQRKTALELDWSPLVRLEHLHTLYIQPVCPSEESLISFLLTVSHISPSLLRSLTIEFEDLLKRHVVMPLINHNQLLTLRLLTSFVTDSSLRYIAKHLPKLEHLEGGPQTLLHLIDAIKSLQNDPKETFPLFPCLRSFISAIVDEQIYSDQTIDAICLAFNPATFTRLGLDHGVILFDRYWDQLLTTYPLLDSIYLADDNRMVQFITSAIASSIFIERIRHLELTFLWNEEQVTEIFSLLSACFNLETLTLHQTSSNSDANRTFMEKTLRGSISSFDSLKRVVIKQEAKQNCVIFNLQPKLLHVTKSDAPQPRLVGIELNPGPPTRSSPPSTSASTLFNDGLRLIHSYINNRDWYSCALVSHHWFAVASSSKSRELKYKRAEITETEIKAARRAMKDHAKGTAVVIAAASPSSLRRHIGTLECAHLTWSTILTQFEFAPNANSMLIARLTADPPAGFFSRTIPPRTDYQLPLTLTSLSLSHASLNESERMDEQLIIDLIGRCHSLTHLVYNQSTSPKQLASPTLTFSSWSQLIHLTSITVGIFIVSDFTEKSLWLCIFTHFTQLTYLRVEPPLSLSSTVAPPLSPPTNEPAFASGLFGLRTFICPVQLSSSTLRQLYSVMPHLTELRSVSIRSQPIHLELLPLFRSLKDLTLTTEPVINGAPTNGYVPEENYANALSQCVSLTRLQFDGWTWKEPRCWSRLGMHLPHLTQLDFCNMTTRDPLPEMLYLNSQSLWDCIRRLSLNSCSRLSHLLFREQLEKFTSLTHFKLIGCIPDGEHAESIITRFESPTYCPLLESINIETSSLSLGYNLTERRKGCAIIRQLHQGRTEHDWRPFARPFLSPEAKTELLNSKARANSSTTKFMCHNISFY